MTNSNAASQVTFKNKYLSTFMNNISISFKGWKHWSGKSRQIQILLLLLLITYRGEVTCPLKFYHFRIGNNEAVHSYKQ